MLFCVLLMCSNWFIRSTSSDPIWTRQVCVGIFVIPACDQHVQSTQVLRFPHDPYDCFCFKRNVNDVLPSLRAVACILNSSMIARSRFECGLSLNRTGARIVVPHRWLVVVSRRDDDDGVHDAPSRHCFVLSQALTYSVQDFGWS